MNKLLETSMKYLAGIGALNLGTSEFLKFDILSYIPSGIFSTIATIAIGVSGGYIIYWTFNKKV